MRWFSRCLVRGLMAVAMAAPSLACRPPEPTPIPQAIRCETTAPHPSPVPTPTSWPNLPVSGASCAGGGALVLRAAEQAAPGQDYRLYVIFSNESRTALPIHYVALLLAETGDFTRPLMQWELGSNSLAPGATDVRVFELRLPTSLAPGLHYVVLDTGLAWAGGATPDVTQPFRVAHRVMVATRRWHRPSRSSSSGLGPIGRRSRNGLPVMGNAANSKAQRMS